MPGGPVSVRPVRRSDGAPGPGRSLKLKLLGMPPILWSDDLLHFVAGDVNSPVAGRILEKIAARLGAASIWDQGVGRPWTLVVVGDAASRARFIAWAASISATGLSQVGWLVLNKAAHDPGHAVAAVQEAVQVSAAAKVVIVLPEPGFLESEQKEYAWEHGLSVLNLELPVTSLRPMAGGYEEVRPDPLRQELSEAALIVTSGAGSAVSRSREANSLSGSASVDANSATEDAPDPRDDLETGPSPWRS